jgi:uncharacterized protein (DUF4415 family)
MNKAYSKQKSGTNWEKLAVMPNSEIDLSDNPELDMAFFENAELRMPKAKKPISLRLDDDVFNWFRHQGKGYQTRINAVLRLYMQARSSASKSPGPMHKSTYRRHSAKRHALTIR